MSRPVAAYDALFIVEGLTKEFDLALEGEVHTLAYLALLLSISAGRDAEAWGYSFVSTATATPFSATLDEAVTDLAGQGLLGAEGPKLTSARSAASVLETWVTLSGNRRRQPFLRAAVAAASSLSPSAAIRSVHREPQLSRAEQLGELRVLPEKLGLAELHGDLKQVDEVLREQGLGKKRDPLLFARAHLWLTYLASEEFEADAEQGEESRSAA